MKLLGRDIPVRDLVIQIGDRLRVRGLPTSAPVEVPSEGVEPRVEPLTYNLNALEEHADPTRGLPLHTHRGGMGQLVLAAKWTFRKTAQVFINETLGRQRVFNGLVRDSYAQLSAEVIRLRREVEELKARGPVPAKPAPAPAPPPAQTAPRGVRLPATEAPAAQPPRSSKETPATQPPRSAKEAPAAQPPRSGKGTPAAKPPSSSKETSAAQPPRSGKGAPAAKPSRSAKEAPAARSSTPPKQPLTAKDVPASARKHAPEASPLSAGPAAASEPVLPKPRHARTEASRPAPTRHGGTSNGATPVEQPAPRQRPPGAKGPRRRKGR